MPVPQALKAYVDEYGPAMGLVGNSISTIQFAIWLAELAGWVESETDQLSAQLEQISQQIAAATAQIIERLDQVEEVQLVGDVTAQVQNLVDFASATEEAKTEIGALILTKLNENDAKLGIAIGHAEENGNPTRASIFATKRVENWANRKVLKERDAVRPTPDFSGLSTDTDALAEYIDTAQRLFEESLVYEMPLGQTINEEEIGIGDFAVTIVHFKFFYKFRDHMHVYAEGTCPPGLQNQFREQANTLLITDIHELFVEHEFTNNLKELREALVG